MSDDKPVMLEHTLWCPEHMEPFRAKWPLGYAVAQIRLFQKACEDDEIMRACGYDPEKGQQADVAQLSHVLNEYSPICCRLKPEDLQAIYDEALPA